MNIRRIRGGALAVAALLVATGQVHAQHEHAVFEGPWDVSFESQMGPMTLVFEMEAEGEELTGTTSSMTGDAVIVGTQSGDDLEFTLLVDQPDHQVQLYFSGTIDGDAAAGAVSIMGETYEWTAERSDTAND